MTRSMALSLIGVSHVELTEMILSFRSAIRRETCELLNSFNKG